MPAFAQYFAFVVCFCLQLNAYSSHLQNSLMDRMQPSECKQFVPQSVSILSLNVHLSFGPLRVSCFFYSSTPFLSISVLPNLLHVCVIYLTSMPSSAGTFLFWHLLRVLCWMPETTSFPSPALSSFSHSLSLFLCLTFSVMPSGTMCLRLQRTLDRTQSWYGPHPLHIWTRSVPWVNIYLAQDQKPPHSSPEEHFLKALSHFECVVCQQKWIWRAEGAKGVYWSDFASVKLEDQYIWINIGVRIPRCHLSFITKLFLYTFDFWHSGAGKVNVTNDNKRQNAISTELMNFHQQITVHLSLFLAFLSFLLFFFFGTQMGNASEAALFVSRISKEHDYFMGAVYTVFCKFANRC